MSSHSRVFPSLLRCVKRTSAAVVFFWPAVALSDYYLLCSRQKKRKKCSQTACNEFYALFHLSCVSNPGSDSSPVVSKLSLLINYLLGKRLGYARGEDVIPFVKEPVLVFHAEY